MRRKISACVDGGTSGPSSMRRRGARTPIGASGNFMTVFAISHISFYSLAAACSAIYKVCFKKVMGSVTFDQASALLEGFFAY